jgi:hypothetical protein
MFHFYLWVAHHRFLNKKNSLEMLLCSTCFIFKLPEITLLIRSSTMGEIGDKLPVMRLITDRSCFLFTKV